MELLIIFLILFAAVGVAALSVGRGRTVSSGATDAEAKAVADELRRAYDEIDRLRRENESLRRRVKGE